MKSIQQVAKEVRDLLMRHISTNTADKDVSNEEARDARIKTALNALAREGKLPPKMEAAPPAVTWTPGNDILANTHVLRIVGDSQAANTYDSEDVWVVQIDPPCPAGLRQIVLRSRPHSFGPWLSNDEVLMRDIDEQWLYLNLATSSGVKIGWGVPTRDGARFARVHGPGWNIATLEILETRTAAVQHTLETGQKLTPAAFDEAGRILTCHEDAGTRGVVLVDTLNGVIVTAGATGRPASER